MEPEFLNELEAGLDRFLATATSEEFWAAIEAADGGDKSQVYVGEGWEP